MIKEIKEADNVINELNGVTYEKAEMLRARLEKCTSSVSDLQVQSSHKTHSREDALLLLAETTSLLDNAQESLKGIYKRIEDRDLRIYFDKNYMLNGYSANEKNRILEEKYGIGKNRINKICRKIEKKHKSTP